MESLTRVSACASSLILAALLIGCGGTSQPFVATHNLALSATALDLGAQQVTTTSAQKVETLTNSGNSALSISSVVVSGTNAGDFSADSSACGSSLAGGASCSVNVTFTPSQSGPASATLTITDDSIGSPQSVALTGVGLNPGADATLSVTSLAFGDEIVLTTSPPQTVTLSNYGTATLNITSIVASAEFGETDNCGTSLASGASCIVNVTFTPGMPGNFTGTLSFTDNGPGSPQMVSLTGTGSRAACSTQGEPCRDSRQCCPGLKCRGFLRFKCE